jgi:glycosyltransferase involved in cell wall biosynthesis
LYKVYQNSKYIIDLIPVENYYLFKKWGINSLLMNNFITYEYNSTLTSSLASKVILMIGRGADKYKRFQLGILAMEYISKEIDGSEMIIISDLNNIDHLISLVINLNLEYIIKFFGFTLMPELFFKKASLHIFPSLSESFGLVLSETKIYGIPNILLGIDYVTISKGGTIIIYDDRPESIAEEATKILKNNEYKKKLGKEARKSMAFFKNDFLLIKWIKLLLSIFNNGKYYENMITERYVYTSDMISILNKQIELLKIRNYFFKNITINNIKNFTFLEEMK